ncbi:WD40 repeat protein [Ophidiomyces ophidiicola]|uniref:WD40 repeat protein n=1 Tax=Ophidiomyces ophidiicola TaxID=1387563 RepID=UPI0020C574A9|nr:WD40 repeat protein [Ophidiomyces ophidiicola]KAI1944670.1 WD40 repeat protein [Ophidiomyces ophidiicola]
MYWPNGVPRIYAVNGPGIDPPELDDGAAAKDERGENTRPKVDRGGDGKEEQSVDSSSTVWASEPIKGLRVSKNGQLFATMTQSSLAVWQTKPTAVIAAVKRSPRSLKNYGPNVALLMRPDAAIIVVQTLHGYLITYSVAVASSSNVYHQRFLHTQLRRHHGFVADDSHSIREASIRFRVVIKVDAGISKALALDNELMVATVKPAAIQSIRWTPDKYGHQTTTELLHHIPWFSKTTAVLDMVYDRAMNLLLWITSDGQVYAVQHSIEDPQDGGSPKYIFKGHKFHDPRNSYQRAEQVAVNARFSLLAVSCVNGEVFIYSARDYMGNIPLSHKLSLPASPTSMGAISFLSYSPDGYCLFAGYKHGWTTWSVFGKAGGNSFNVDSSQVLGNDEKWLTGVSAGAWIGGGSDIILTAPNDRRVWILEFARSALTGCFSSANLARALLQTGTEFILYRGHDLPDLTTISGKDSLWHHAQYPPHYLHSQWPIRSCCVSQDGKYVAISGRRGLAHYSVQSHRWKTFEDQKQEDSFAVQGGMCWYGHILIAAVECNAAYELRMYSRELVLNDSSILYAEPLPSPAVFIGPSGEDSLLVYTYENILYHYVINTTGTKLSLVQVGQIAFHGIVRAPTRVRAISWVLPDDQLHSQGNGDPSQDVAVASVLFLVDGKLVLLQPSISDAAELKYDMRIVAHDVEYYILMRDQLYYNFAPPGDESLPPSPSAASALNYFQSDISLRDSLWIFGGKDLLVWSDVHDVIRLKNSSIDISKPLPIPVDFYPLSILLNKGIILGIEPEVTQRRDVPFTLHRFAIRSHLFLPYILQYNLTQFDSPSAFSICHHFSHLSYFPHALEILLHHVLDEEVDNPHIEDHDSSKQGPLLPSVLSFLQAGNPPELYLDILVQCIRKTELRSWKTLFAYLPPPSELFEQALKFNSLKTAGGYLLVLHAFDDSDENNAEKTEESVVRLLLLASHKGDWELCGELARFLLALDSSGDMLRRAVVRVGLRRGDQLTPPALNGYAIPDGGLKATETVLGTQSSESLS